MFQDPGDGSHQYFETWKLQSHSDLRGGDEDPTSWWQELDGHSWWLSLINNRSLTAVTFWSSFLAHITVQCGLSRVTSGRSWGWGMRDNYWRVWCVLGGQGEGYGDFLKWIVVMVAQLWKAILGDPPPSSNRAQVPSKLWLCPLDMCYPIEIQCKLHMEF